MKLVTNKKQGGFTLVELVMVIVVIALLSAYIGPKFASLDSQARAAQLNKISGVFSETLGIVKAISVAELDSSVADLADAINGDDPRTAVDYDGQNSTQNATDDSGQISIAGEDILTEFHYPKATNPDGIAITELTGIAAALTAADLQAQDAASIVYAIDTATTNTTVYLVEDADEDATVADLKTACGYATTNVDNNGTLNSLETTLIAAETRAGATLAGNDRVRIYHCGMLNSSDYSTTALDAQLLTASNCSVTYTDSGVFTGVATIDTYVDPSVTVQAGGC